MKASELTPEHVGQRVSITGNNWQVTGVLQEVSTYHDEIDESPIADPDREPVLGAKWTVLKVSGWEHNVNDAWAINVEVLG